MKCHRGTGRHSDSVRTSVEQLYRGFSKNLCVGVCRCVTQLGAGLTVNIRPLLNTNRFYEPQLNPLKSWAYADTCGQFGVPDARGWC